MTNIDPVLDNLIAHLSKPVQRSARSLDGSIERKTAAGYRPPVFAVSSFNADRLQVVGTIGDHEIRVDPMLRFPKLVVSKKFRDTFGAEMSSELQSWMSEKFGYEYPVYAEDKTIIMHPDALQRLQEKLAGRP